MRVVLTTLGTDGDVFPHIGLGAELRTRGHHVVLAAPEPYRERAASFGLEFCPLVSTTDVDRMLANPDLWHPLKSGLVMARWGGPMIQSQYELISSLVAQPGSVLVSNPGVLASRLVQERSGVPLASLVLQPGILPSNVAPPEMPGGLTIPAWLPHPLRRLYWLAVDGAAYGLVSPSLNRVRKGLGMSPVRRLFRWWLSNQLVIGLFPSWYASRPPDWPEPLRLAGFGRFDGGHQELPDDVRQFCLEGPPPIVFTFGTGMKHATDFFRSAVAACESLGVRGLLLSKFPDAIPPDLPPQVRHCRFAPFRQLLPLCAAVVHHGGIGTTAAALESGCPQLVLPLAWDQPDNAARVKKLGAGLSLGLWRRRVKSLSSALQQVLTSDVRATCQSIARQAGESNGFETAANWVEELAATTDT